MVALDNVSSAIVLNFQNKVAHRILNELKLVLGPTHVKVKVHTKHLRKKGSCLNF